MASKQGKKAKFKVRNLFSKNKYKKFSRSKERLPRHKESDESLTTLRDDVVEENEELNFDLKTSHTTVVNKSQQQKRRSVRLDVGDMLYGGQVDRETEPSSSGHTGTDSRGGEGARPGEEQDLDLPLVANDDEETFLSEDNTIEKVFSAEINPDRGTGESVKLGEKENDSSSDAETTEKVCLAEVHTDRNAENLTRPSENVMNSANIDVTGNFTPSEERAPSLSKKVEGKSKKKRKKVTFSPTSTKYIQLEASRETLDIYVVEEQTIKKKKSKKKKIRKRIRKAARLSWRYLVAGFQNMTLATPFYVTTTTVEGMYMPRPSNP
ncbi:uncharacterized protein LOC118424787 [Branchiostoma floridae]|uniref:Uncharacterized protein LOC118424787 n=1 Tax=Branchiostoma floridae TaxID=7739 RepID=A0A9J7LUR6_BRAFL|nr:uncharacterized protein LOC118424787 [Branchiostoma floridae]XP_035689465.1 uncharacterized protein LOC118424787 [Branchiostoma floridae]XP_035689471.1 uncharacterized protein LOC118424787 [Branchiostoma floridae]